MSDVRRQLTVLRAEAYRLANSIELLRQAQENALPTSIKDALRLATLNCEIAANLLKRARVEGEQRAKVLGFKVDNLTDLSRAMKQDATAFPVCIRCGCDAYECACNAPEAA